MAMYILGQIKQQAEALHLRALWLTKENAWTYLTWDAQSKQHVRNDEATPLAHSTILQRLDRLHCTPSSGQRASSIPLVATSHGDLRHSGYCVHHGYRPENGSSPGGLHHSPFSQPAVGDTDRVYEHAPGQAPEIHPGQSHPASDRQAVGQMRLENHCYLNAFLTAWMWGSRPYKHPALQVHAQARQGVQALLEARRSLHVLSHPIWSLLFSDWQDPHSQHDIAEFASFAASALSLDCMRMMWQSRVATDTGAEVTESGHAVTLGLDLTSMQSPDLHIQGLINHWFTQVVTCAFSDPPSLAVT